MFKFDFASSEQLARWDAAEWLTSAPAFVADLAGQGDKVRSYARSLAAQLLMTDVPDPQASGLS